MMQSQEWRKVGKIKDAHGLRGEVFIFVFSKDFSWAEDLDRCAISTLESEQMSRTFEVEKWRPQKEGLLLKLKGIDDRTAAEKLKNSLFYIPQELLESEEGETIYLSEIDGFEVRNDQDEKLGRVVGFSSNLAQDLLILEKSQGGTAEIPFVEAFILEINFESRFLKMSLPEGILDLDSL